MDDAPPTITMIAGPNGSGKTRLSNSLISSGLISPDTYINPDHIARSRYGDWDSAQARQKAIAHAAGLIKANLKSKTSFALETVLSPSGVALLNRACRYGFVSHLYFIGTDDPSINIARVAARTRAGGHDIPEATIVRRYYEAIDTLPAAITAADYAIVYDNSKDDHVMTRLFHTEHGHLTEQAAGTLPLWVTNVVRTL